jgi:hypothetical protein
MPTEDSTEAAAAPLLDELLRTVPRLVDRTRSQAELARLLVAMLPCVGPLLGRRANDEAPVGPGAPEHERVDVLGVLADDEPGDESVEAVDELDDATSSVDEVDAEPAAGAEADGVSDAAVPVESDLPIQDYDSLAASQVVPRLATLSADELQVVRAYEQATRGRQTILHRVAQLLAG